MLNFRTHLLRRWPLLVGGLCVAIPALVYSESTKEIFTDAGFYSPNQNLFIYNPPSPVTDSPDATAPEGQRSFTTHQPATQWSGWGVYNVAAPNTFTISPQDYSDYANGSLRFWLKSTVLTRVTLEYGTAGAQPPKVIIPPTGNAWTEQVIPISAFGLSAANLAQLAAPFIIVSDAATGDVDYFVDHIRWTKPVASLVAFPASATAAAGNHREFVAEGRSAANEFVDVYSSWSVTGAGASVVPSATATAGTPSRYTILTLGSANAAVTAQADGFSASVPVTVSAPASAPFGIVSETAAGLNLDVDSKLLTTVTGTGSAVTLANDTVNFVEGSRSLRVDIQLANPGTAGWFVQWGTGASDPDTNTKDMSAYYDGSIRFWFKGPPALQDFLVAGIRSGNVPSRSELSQVSLNALPIFDNAWHSVTLPIAAFAKASPWADLARTKLFFELIARYSGPDGGGPGAQTFWVDNVRWDPSAPGALASLAISPASPVTVPLGGKRNFIAQGFDASGFPVDVLPAWSMLPSLGTLTPQGSVASLKAQDSPVSGTLTASVGPIRGSVSVNVANPVYTQSYNVYSDAGTGGTLGVSKGTAAGSDLLLTQLSGGSAPGTTNYMHASWTLVNSPGLNDAFAVWFVGENAGASRFMQPYADGILQFSIRSTIDLQISLRSLNITAGTEKCKFRLSQLGIPLDGSWQQVTLSLADFKTAEPLLDFSQIATYFTIGVLSNQIGAGSGTFDVANVKWLTASTAAVDPEKIYAGLVAKQNPTSGLLLSYDNDATLQAVTYDQALAAMVFTYRGTSDSLARAGKIFDAYKLLNVAGQGFYEEYNRDTRSVLVQNRSAGPNAWMMLALMQYRSVTGDAQYDAVLHNLAAWLLTLQTPDGGLLFGEQGAGNVLLSYKSTEHNLSGYAALKAYSELTGDAAVNTAVTHIRAWLDTVGWNPGLRRFNVGTLPDSSINTDKALDIASWAPLSLSSYTAVLSVAEADFRNTQTSDLTGFTVDGFDFGGVPAAPATYKDAVWLEGTAQMSTAFGLTGDSARATYFLNEIEKAVVSTSLTTQGLPYATNPGTAYGGFLMDSLHPAVSSMAWYLFAKNRFNPFRPAGGMDVQILNIADNLPAPKMTWSPVSLPAGWVRADQYFAVTMNTNRSVWGVQIYTDNMSADAAPAFTGNSAVTDPSGLVDSVNTQTRLPIAWSIKDSTSSLPAAHEPNDLTNSDASQWLYFKDRATVDIPLQKTVHFADGEPFVEILDSSLGLHTTQAGFSPGSFPLTAIYLQANFTGAVTPRTYQTSTLRLEFFHE